MQSLGQQPCPPFFSCPSLDPMGAPRHTNCRRTIRLSVCASGDRECVIMLTEGGDSSIASALAFLTHRHVPLSSVSRLIAHLARFSIEYLESGRSAKDGIDLYSPFYSLFASSFIVLRAYASPSAEASGNSYLLVSVRS